MPGVFIWGAVGTNSLNLVKYKYMELKETDIYTSLTTSAYRRPEAVALVAAGKNWTYHKLLMSVDRAADMLFEAGIRKGDRVAIALRNSVEVVITNYALYKIGAISVPINFMISKADELKFILGDCNVKMVVTQAEYLRHYAGIKKDLPDLKYILTTTWRRLEDLQMEECGDNKKCLVHYFEEVHYQSMKEESFKFKNYPLEVLAFKSLPSLRS